MPVDLQKARELFLHAVGKLPPERWEEYMAEGCAGDAELKRQVSHFLQVHREAGSFLESPAVALGDTGDDRTSAERPSGEAQGSAVGEPGTLIGPYKLLQPIGEGGMGTVWMAEQTDAVKRTVALKVIKAGLDSRQVLARFGAERQALALMDHPNIAKVLEAGSTEQGRPYFVMELVKGVPITTYCDERRLTPGERLELAIPVCQAVQHAHQKGIIHRDLKPSNVLVGLYDGKPIPKVIDFGVAKATGEKLTDSTLFTGFGAVVGTPEYMSPEQAQLDNLDIDTRSDIYSLGVLLYELLTGSTPLDRKRLGQAVLLEVLRVIREEEPPRPSTRLSTTDELPSIAACRNIEPRKLSGLVRGDLDWIVMKALEKDRNRRYDTANGLARDLERYLNGDPVEAGPPSAAYRLRKFARKHRAALSTAGAFAGLLLLAAAVSTFLAFRANRAESDTNRALIQVQNEQAKTQAALTRATGEEQKAQLSAAEARAVLVFFQDNVLAATRPERQEGGLRKDVTIRRAIDAAEPKIATAFRDQPAAEAAIRHTLGKTYFYLGALPLAIRQLERSRQLHCDTLDPDHPNKLSAMNMLASAYQEAGRLNEALPLLEESLKLAKAKLGPDHPDTLATMSNLGSAYHDAGRSNEALPLLEETLKLEKAKLGPDHPSTHSTMNRLAGAYQAVGRRIEALPLLEELLTLEKAKLGPEHPDTLGSMNNLAWAYRDAGRATKAIPLLEETLRLVTLKLDPDHPHALITMNNLANAYSDAGRLTDAMPLLEKTLKIRRAKLGPDHPDTLSTMNNLASAYQDAGRPTEAVPLFEETFKLAKVKLGPDHPHTLTTMNNLANAYRDAGRLSDALPLLEETLKLRRAKLIPDHPDTLDSMNSLASAYRAAGRLTEALPLFEETLKLQRAKQGPDHPHTLGGMNNLAGAYQDAGRLTEAVPLFEETLELIKVKLGPYHPNTLSTMNNLASAYRDAGRLSDAFPLFDETLKLQRAKLGPDHPHTLATMNDVVKAYLESKRWTEAEMTARECQVLRGRSNLDAWQRFHTMSQLGAALAGQKKLAEAESLLIDGYEGLKAREAKIPARARKHLAAAAARVVPFYEAWGKPAKAADWRQKLTAKKGVPRPSKG